MAINNPQKFMNGIWDWDFISEVLPPKMKVSDIDGVIERNGWLLALETKETEVEKIPLGQYILYENMVRTGTTTVFFLFGEKDNPKYFQIMCPIEWGKPSKQIHITDKVPCDQEMVKKWTKRWFDKANERKVNHNQDIQF